MSVSEQKPTRARRAAAAPRPRQADSGPTPAAAESAGDLGALGWALVGEPLAAALAALLTRAWSGVVPGVVIEQGHALPAGFSSSAAWRVLRLGPPLKQRLWLFWDAEGAERAASALRASLAVEVPGLAAPELVTAADFPADGLLLPFSGVGPRGSIPLVIGVEAQGLAQLAMALGGVPPEPEGAASADDPGAPTNWAGAGVTIEDLEVEASVYVGGGLYPLSTLAGLRPGSILPLTTEVGESAVIAINGRVIAFGEVMVTPEQTLAVRLTRVALGSEGRMGGPAWLQPAAAGNRRLRSGPAGPR